MEMDKLLEWYLCQKIHSRIIFYLFTLGWQTRWFVLQNGCLTYYKSQEEVITGCKGSLKVQACDIIGKLDLRVLQTIFFIFGYFQYIPLTLQD